LRLKMEVFALNSPSQPIRLIIAEDEPAARERLKSLISEHQGFEVIAETGRSDELATLIRSVKADAAILDIHMPPEPVIDVLRSIGSSIGSSGTELALVFLTAYTEHAVTAFELNAVDYLLKPVRRERFAQALEKIKAQLGDKAPLTPPGNEAKLLRIAVSDGNASRILKLDEIQSIIVEDGITLIGASGKRYMADHSLQWYADKLTSFIQISRTALIPLDTISKIERDGSGYRILTHQGETLSLSRRRYSELKHRLIAD
jgi:DNA-binding LytR/AlgR family response regulator